MRKARKFVCRRILIKGFRSFRLKTLNLRVPFHVFEINLQEQFRQIMKLEAGESEATRRKIKDEVCRLLDPKICQLIRRRFRTYLCSDPDFFWDLKAAALCAVMEKLPEYDPLKGEPFTYFYPYIMHELVDETSRMKHGVHGAFFSAQKRMIKIRKDYEDSNRSPDIADYACAMGLPLQSVRNLLIESSMKTISLDGLLCDITPGDGEVNGRYLSPEEIMIRRDSFAFLLNKINMKFSALEKVIFFMYLDGLRAAEIGRRIGKSNDQILRVIESCRHTLQFDLEIRDYYSGIWKNDDEILDSIGVPNFAEE